MDNQALITELKARLADRYTAAELVELLDCAVEDIIEIYEERILRSHMLLEEVGYILDDDDETITEDD